MAGIRVTDEYDADSIEEIMALHYFESASYDWDYVEGFEIVTFTADYTGCSILFAVDEYGTIQYIMFGRCTEGELYDLFSDIL